MTENQSRRVFLSGALACGALSAGALYLTPGGRSEAAPPPPEPPLGDLRLVTGADPTGARDLLIAMWNAANPDARVSQVPIPGGSAAELETMRVRARNRQADLLNLDVIDIPEFAAANLLTPIGLPDAGEFLSLPLLPGRRSGDDNTYWAVPFNTDVGMLFHRTSATEELPDLRETINQWITKGSQQFVGQLRPTGQYGEAYVVNVLEHALSQHPGLLPANGDASGVSRNVQDWRDALAPLKGAVDQKKVRLSDSESDSLIAFKDRELRFMRNWPVKYRELQQNRDPAVRTGGIQVGPLGVGILGGQSLAIVAGSPRADAAREFIAFMTGVQAQWVLALHGLAPVRTNVYGGATSGPVTVLEATLPHLRQILEAVDSARPRPIHRNYRRFAEVVSAPVNALLTAGTELPDSFGDEIDKAFA